MPLYTVYNTVKSGLRATIFLDGKEVDNVIEADTDEGYVLTCVKDEDGFAQPTADGTQLETQRLTGRVEVKTEPLNA